jgi:hypothetical protein
MDWTLLVVTALAVAALCALVRAARLKNNDLSSLGPMQCASGSALLVCGTPC